MNLKKIAIATAAFALVLGACGGGESDGGSDTTPPPAAGAGDPVAGASVYSGTCSACHAADLSGIDGLGKELAPSAFVADMSEEELSQFIIDGRSVSDPENSTGIDMPPRGGNPSLSDQEIADVSAYLQAQQ